MNEQIKKLAEQAGYKPLPGFDFANSLEETYLKKFAELIVRECVQYIEDKFDFCGDELIIAEKLKEHFGVES